MGFLINSLFPKYLSLKEIGKGDLPGPIGLVQKFSGKFKILSVHFNNYYRLSQVHLTHYIISM